MHQEPESARESEGKLELVPLQVMLPGLALVYALTLLSACTLGALNLGGQGPPPPWLEALAAHGVALTGLLVQALLGLGLLSALGLARALEWPTNGGLFAWTAGFVASEALFMGLSAGNLLGSTSVVAIGAITLLASAPWMVRRGRLGFALLRELWRADDPGAQRTGLLAILGLVLVLVWLLPLLVQTGLPNSDWDSALYHLPLADRYLAGLLWNPDPLFSAYSFPGGASLCYAALQSLGFESAVIPFNFWVLVLACASAGVLAYRLAGARAAFWGVIVFGSTHLFWQQAVDPRIDGFLTLFVLVATTALCSLIRSGDARFLALAAVAANAAMGVKYTGLVFGGVIFGVATLWWAKTSWQSEAWRSDRRSLLRHLLLCSALLLIPGAFWYAGNLALHQDPVFPMMRGDYFNTETGERRYVSSDLPLPGAHDDLEIQRAELQLRKLAKPSAPTHLFDYLDILRRPGTYAVKPNHFASPFAALFLFLPFFLPRKRPQRSAQLALYGTGLGLFVLMAPLTNLTRYLMPVMGLFAVGAGLVIAALPSRLLRACIGVALALLVVRNAAFEWEKLRLLQPEPYLMGRLEGGRLEWLARVGFNFTPAMAEATSQLNAEFASGGLGTGQAIFMVGEGKGRLLHSEYLPDSTWYMQRWLAELLNAELDYGLVLESLRKQGVGHLLVNRGYFDWVIRHTDANTEQLAFAMVHLRRFSDQHAKIVYDHDGIQLLELEIPR